jgi:hypothetical protein
VTTISAPSGERAGRSFTVTINYRNAGNTDLLAPVMHLAVTSPGLLSFTSDLSAGTTGLDLIAVNPNGPAGILPPGAQGSLTVYATSTGTGTSTFQLSLGQYPAVPIDWAAAGPIIRPPGLTDAFWTALLGQLQHDIGSTWDLYQRTLAQDTTLLPAGDGLDYSLVDVNQLEYTRALSILYPSVTGHLFLGDTSHPLGNVDVQLIDSATNTAYQAFSLSDGSFLIPSVSAGTYALQFSGFVPTTTAELVVGSLGLGNVQLVVAPAGSITGGVVESPGGAPVGNVVVTAVAADGTTYTAETGTDGTYQIDSLPAGVYEVQAGGGTLTQAVVSSVNVAAGEVSPNVDLVVQAAATISGTVMGPGGPVSGAAVAALAADGTGFSALTDATGAYTITGLSAQTYTLSASDAGLVTTEIDNVQLAAGGSLTGEDFTLTTSGSVTGQITQNAGGAAAPDVFLTLQGTAGTFSSQADDNGIFSVNDLPPGSYVLTTTSPSFMTVSTNVTVTAGAATTANLTTALFGSVTGTVTNSTTGIALPNVIVQATQASGEVTSALTDSQGNYQLDGLDAGAYQIVLGDEGTPGVAQTSVTLSPSHATAVVNLSIAVAGTVSGTVFLADGVTPVPAAQVNLVSAGIQVLTMSTDAQGQYAFVVVAAGTYELQATAVGLAFPSIEAVAVGGGTQKAGLNFRAGSAQITGVVQAGASGQPIGGATVTIEQTNPGQTPVAVEDLTTAADGSFALPNAVPVTYRITVSADTYATVSQTLNVTAGAPAQVVIKLNPEALLQGTVRDAATSVPLTDASLLLTSANDPLAGANAVVDPTGAYELGGVPPGIYQLLVQSPGYSTALIGTVTLGTSPTLLNIALDASSTTVSGTVTSAAGPLGGATVIVKDASGRVWATAVTNDDGTYTVNTLPLGSYSATAVVPGYGASALVPIAVANGRSVGGIDFLLTPGAITDANAPVPADTNALVPADAAPHLPANWMQQVEGDLLPFHDTLTPELQAVLANCDDPKPYLVQTAQNLIYAANRAYFDYLDANRAAKDVPAVIRAMQANIGIVRQIASSVAGLSGYDVNFVFYTQGARHSISLSALPGLISQGIQEAADAYGDLAAGNIDDATTHTGAPQITYALSAMFWAQVFLRTLPFSQFGDHPVLYTLSGYYAKQLQLLSDALSVIKTQIGISIEGLYLAQDYFAKGDAWRKATAAASGAIDEVAANCSCQAGAQHQSVSLSGISIIPMTQPAAPEPG